MAVNRNKNCLNQKKVSRKRNPKHPKALTIHHIVPRSRGGSESKENKAKIIMYHHGVFHDLFQNMTPCEIIVFLTVFVFKTDKWLKVYCFNRSTNIEEKVEFIIDDRLTSYHRDKFYLLFGDMNYIQCYAYLENYFFNKQTKWIDEVVNNFEYYTEAV